MSKYDVTIAIPVFNVAAFVEKSLRSALTQTVGNIEVLILNDCSTDNSVEVIRGIAKEYQCLLTIYNAPENAGVGVMRNKAIELAQGDYLYFLDSDDTMTPDCIELMLSIARKDNMDLVIGSYINVREKGETLEKEDVLKFEKPDEFAKYAFTKRYGYVGGVWNKLMKTEKLRSNHISFPNFRVGEDVPFIFRLITNVQRVVLIDDVTYHYVTRPGSLCQYNPRAIIPKGEIDTHVASKFLLKEILLDNKGKVYYVPMLCIVMDYCLDTARVMIEKRNVLEERVPPSVLKNMLSFSVSLHDILKYGGKRDFFNYLLCHTPISFVSLFYVIRKVIRDRRHK